MLLLFRKICFMDIKKRINARKIVLSYFYQHCFFSLLNERGIVWDEGWSTKFFDADPELKKENSKFLDDAFLKAVENKKQEILHWDEEIKEKIAKYAEQYDIDEDFSYIMWHFFDQWSSDDVDVDYVLQVWWSLKKYEKGFDKKINSYTKTFSYEKMDPMDQVLLLLWYIEYKVLWTPKEVIINEMVELAKRYADDWSPKLVNWILHELLSKEESEK